MHANGFTLQTARDHEAELLRLAAPAKILSPRPQQRRTGSGWRLRRWRRRAVRPAHFLIDVAVSTATLEGGRDVRNTS